MLRTSVAIFGIGLLGFLLSCVAIHRGSKNQRFQYTFRYVFELNSREDAYLLKEIVRQPSAATYFTSFLSQKKSNQGELFKLMVDAGDSYLDGNFMAKFGFFSMVVTGSKVESVESLVTALDSVFTDLISIQYRICKEVLRGRPALRETLSPGHRSIPEQLVSGSNFQIDIFLDEETPKFADSSKPLNLKPFEDVCYLNGAAFKPKYPASIKHAPNFIRLTNLPVINQLEYQTKTLFAFCGIFWIMLTILIWLFIDFLKKTGASKILKIFM